MMMRSAREAAGLHVAALAVSMKIPVKKLEALEADRLDLLHDAVFVRALAASVCRALKIDAAPILLKLPLNTAPKLNPDERGINAPFHSPSDATAMPLPALLTKPSTLIFVALVLAGIAVFFMPSVSEPEVAGEPLSQSKEPADSSTGQAVTMQPPQQVMSSGPEAVADRASAPVRGSGETTLVATTSVAEAPPVKIGTPPIPVAVAGQTMSVSDRPMVSASLPIVAASRPASAPLLPTTGTIVFKARGVTWVKVVDAKGIVQLSKTLAEGEVAGASGAVPLSVVIGRVDATDVEVRGQTFNLSAVSRDNVARFEVK
jgi:cytoskeleton protein RodZ